MATTNFVVKNGLTVTDGTNINSTTDAASSSDTSSSLYVAGGVAVAKKLHVGTDFSVGSDVTLTGDLAVNGGDITTTATTFNLLNATATTVNFAGAATTLEIGAATGTTNINNNLDVDGDINIDGGDLTVSTATFNLANTTATTVNFAGAGTSVNIGASTGTTTINTPQLRVGGVDAGPNYIAFRGTTGDQPGSYNHTYIGERIHAGTEASELLIFKGNDPATTSGPDRVRVFAGEFRVDTYTTATADTFENVGTSANALNRLLIASDGNITIAQDLAVNGGDITTNQTTFNLLNTTVTTMNFAGAGTSVNVGASTGTMTVANPTLTMTNGVAFNMNGANPAIASSNTGTASIFNANITTINFGQAADISMGGTAKTVTVRGALAVNGNTTLGDANTDTVTFTADTANVDNTLTFTINDATANNISYPVKVQHTTSGTAANGIGVGIQFLAESSGGLNKAGANLEAVATSAANGAENFSFVIDTMTSGATAVQALLVNNNTVTVGAVSTATTINTQISSPLTVTTGASGVTSPGNAATFSGGAGGTSSGAGGAGTFKGGDATTSGTGGIATFKSGAAVGTNFVGADTIIEAGNGTGTGGSGKISFRTASAGTSGSTANTMVERFAISNSGNFDLNGDLTIGGNLVVNGLTTTINSNTITVDDKNIELGSVVSKGSLQATLATGTAVVTLTAGDTKGLIPGMTLTVNTGAGAFGASAVIASVDSLVQLTASINHATSGAVTFTAGGVTDFTADGGGITVKGATDKTFNWVRSTGNWTASNNVSAPVLVSTVATGTAPLTVASTTLVTNLNADLLDGQTGSWYQDWTNITNKPDPVVTVTLTGDVTGTANTTLTDLASGTVTVSTTIAANSVALGTDTTGNYMIDVSAGTGISVSHTQGEGSTATITNTGVTGITAGNAITVSAATGSVTINHADTSSVANQLAATNSFISGITFDTYGHVQTITTGSPSGFLTAESDTLATVTARGATTSTACTFNGNVSIGTAANLSFGSQTRQMIDLWSTSYGIGVQSSTTYFRSASRFSWHRGGAHTDAENNPGSGGTAAMTLDSSSNLTVTGSLFATTKSFLIDHPTKPGMKLRHGSLEGPEDGVYVRGKLVDSNVLELPEYWTGLVHADSITVNLTAAGPGQQLYVERIENNYVYIVNETGRPVNCFYTVYGERKDVEKLVVEIE